MSEPTVSGIELFGQVADAFEQVWKEYTIGTLPGNIVWMRHVCNRWYRFDCTEMRPPLAQFTSLAMHHYTQCDGTPVNEPEPYADDAPTQLDSGGDL